MVEDVAKTVAWYERRLGSDQTSELESDGGLVWAQVERDDVRFIFQRRDNMESELPSLAGAPIGGSLSIYVHVADVEALAAESADIDRVLEMRTSE